MTDAERFDLAIARFDALNAEDPSLEVIGGRERPKALVYAERLTAMLARFAPDASEVLRLAARCQHVQRWKIPRSEYPMTRAGYHRWRTRLRDFHAGIAAEILADVGYAEATVGRVGSLIRKLSLKTDAEAQALEDVVALVFLESYLGGFVAAHADYEDAKLLDILTKTANKMSARGRAAALTEVASPPGFAAAIASAMAR